MTDAAAPNAQRTEEIRARVRDYFGLSHSDEAHLLTGQDVETLLAQGQRLADQDRRARLAHTNVAPREGLTVVNVVGDPELREFVAELFATDD